MGSHGGKETVCTVLTSFIGLFALSGKGVWLILHALHAVLHAYFNCYCFGNTEQNMIS